MRSLPRSSSNLFLSDSEWAFALFLSKVHSLRGRAFRLVHNPFKLPDPDAKAFTHDILRRAMLEAIEMLNQLADEAGITEV